MIRKSFKIHLNEGIVPAKGDWFEEIRRYEKEVLLNRK